MCVVLLVHIPDILQLPPHFSHCLTSSLLARKVSTSTVFRCTLLPFLGPPHPTVQIAGGFSRPGRYIRVRYLGAYQAVLLGWASITSFAGTRHDTPLCSVCAPRPSPYERISTRYPLRRTTCTALTCVWEELLLVCYCLLCCQSGAVAVAAVVTCPTHPQFQVLRTPPRPKLPTWNPIRAISSAILLPVLLLGSARVQPRGDPSTSPFLQPFHLQHTLVILLNCDRTTIANRRSTISPAQLHRDSHQPEVSVSFPADANNQAPT